MKKRKGRSEQAARIWIMPSEKIHSVLVYYTQTRALYILRRSNSSKKQPFATRTVSASTLDIVCVCFCVICAACIFSGLPLFQFGELFLLCFLSPTEAIVKNKTAPTNWNESRWIGVSKAARVCSRPFQQPRGDKMLLVYIWLICR